MSARQLPLGAPVGWTLCSGIGAPEVAMPWVDWRLASDIEPFPRAVLQARFGYRQPEDHNQGEPLLWGDFSDLTPAAARARGVPLPDVIMAGTPCQAFSVAGSRAGLADPRGNLTLKFVELCHAIQDENPARPFVAIWENVPGALSMRDNAFGCLLGGLVGGDGPVFPGGGHRWPGAGMVAGSRAQAAWRVLDAQHFGVPQRRRRVFVVASFGGAADPAKILFERESLHGDPAEGGPARQEDAGSVA